MQKNKRSTLHQQSLKNLICRDSVLINLTYLPFSVLFVSSSTPIKRYLAAMFPTITPRIRAKQKECLIDIVEI